LIKNIRFQKTLDTFLPIFSTGVSSSDQVTLAHRNAEP
jgi:hypothetical protein